MKKNYYFLWLLPFWAFMYPIPKWREFRWFIIHRDYAVDIKDSSTNDVLATYNTPLKSLDLAGQSISVLVSGFLDPQQNNGGPALGLFYVTAAGGDLMAFPLAPLSVSKSTFDSLTVYPNPVSEHLMLKGFSLENISFDIVDM